MFSTSEKSALGQMNQLSKMYLEHEFSIRMNQEIAIDCKLCSEGHC